MPSEKRARQDEGRLNRRVAEVAATKKRQRNKNLRNLVIIAVVVVGGLFAYSALSGDDDEPVSTASSSTTLDPNAETTTTAATETTTPGPAIGDTPCPPAGGADEQTQTFESGPQACIDVAKTYTAKVVTSKGEFTVELDAAAAPKTVNNFVFLARNKYFEGIKFHRIIPGFVVQGGDPQGTGSGGPGYDFADELPTEGPPYYEIGSLAMANSGPATNGSQFFIVTGDNGVNLPAQYSRFGKVTDGMDVVIAIEATGSADGTPAEETTITSVTITES